MREFEIDKFKKISLHFSGKIEFVVIKLNGSCYFNLINIISFAAGQHQTVVVQS